MPNKLELTKEDQVKNIEGTSACSPRRSNNSWKQYWKDHTRNDWPHRCPIFGCTKSPSCGGHVYIDGHSNESEVYIIPLCKSCNHYKKKAWKKVNEGTEAVEVEEADTSGPQGPCYR